MGYKKSHHGPWPIAYKLDFRVCVIKNQVWWHSNFKLTTIYVNYAEAEQRRLPSTLRQHLGQELQMFLGVSELSNSTTPSRGCVQVDVDMPVKYVGNGCASAAKTLAVCWAASSWVLWWICHSWCIFRGRKRSRTRKVYPCIVVQKRA